MSVDIIYHQKYFIKIKLKQERSFAWINSFRIHYYTTSLKYSIHKKYFLDSF